jgi:hypothetical protein
VELQLEALEEMVALGNQIQLLALLFSMLVVAAVETTELAVLAVAVLAQLVMMPLLLRVRPIEEAVAVVAQRQQGHLRPLAAKAL